jgi:hypothetical protein
VRRVDGTRKPINAITPIRGLQGGMSVPSRDMSVTNMEQTCRETVHDSG